MTRDDIAENYPELIVLDPPYFDAAIIGVIHDFNRSAVCYSESKILELLMSESEMEYEEAREYYEFNILGAWMGDTTPMYMEEL